MGDLVGRKRLEKWVKSGVHAAADFAAHLLTSFLSWELATVTSNTSGADGVRDVHQGGAAWLSKAAKCKGFLQGEENGLQ